MYKALAIDSSSNCITFAACNGDKEVSVSLDIGMRQSEKLLITIQYVLEQIEITPSELDFTVLCEGPGAFTGLRLAFAAFKALELAHGCPIYAIPTLDAIAYPYAALNGAVLSVLDAKKSRFYASLYRNGNQEIAPLDASPEDILALLDIEETILVVGPDSELFVEKARAIRPTQDLRILQPVQKNTSFALLALGKQKHEKKADPLKDYDGPVYIRKSEAEENLQA